MKILFNGIKRVLLQDNDKEIDISDGQIVKYEGNKHI